MLHHKRRIREQAATTETTTETGKTAEPSEEQKQQVADFVGKHNLQPDYAVSNQAAEAIAAVVATYNLSDEALPGAVENYFRTTLGYTNDEIIAEAVNNVVAQVQAQQQRSSRPRQGLGRTQGK